MRLVCVTKVRGTLALTGDPYLYYELQVLDTETMRFLAYGMGPRIPAGDKIVGYLPVIDNEFLEYFPKET